MNDETNMWRKVKNLFPNLDSLTQKQIDYEITNAISQTKKDCYGEMREKLITQIKELQEEPTREGMLDIIEKL